MKWSYDRVWRNKGTCDVCQWWLSLNGDRVVRCISAMDRAERGDEDLSVRHRAGHSSTYNFVKGCWLHALLWRCALYQAHAMFWNNVTWHSICFSFSQAYKPSKGMCNWIHLRKKNPGSPPKRFSLCKRKVKARSSQLTCYPFGFFCFLFVDSNGTSRQPTVIFTEWKHRIRKIVPSKLAGFCFTPRSWLNVLFLCSRIQRPTS